MAEEHEIDLKELGVTKEQFIKTLRSQVLKKSPDAVFVVEDPDKEVSEIEYTVNSKTTFIIITPEKVFPFDFGTAKKKMKRVL